MRGAGQTFGRYRGELMTLRVAQFDQKIEFDYFNETAYTPRSRYHDDLRSVMVPYLVVAALFEAFKSRK